MRAASMATALVLWAIGALAQDKVSGIDFLVDWQSWTGKRVHVGGCFLQMANAQTIFCNVRNQGHQVGSVWIVSLSLDREDLRRSLRECPGYSNAAICQVEVSGTVVRVPGAEVPGLV